MRAKPVCIKRRSKYFISYYRPEVIKCESAKMHMYKMRKFDAKYFAFGSP